MKQSFVYILKCADNSYYTGVTNNLTQRFFQHETGFYPDCYTANKDLSNLFITVNSQILLLQ